MVTRIKKGASREEIKSLLKKFQARKKQRQKSMDLKKYCGMLKLKQDPLEMQKSWRDEWE